MEAAVSATSRRHALWAAVAVCCAQSPVLSACAAVPPAGAVTIRPDLAPDQSSYDPTDTDLREAAALLQRALNAEEVGAEEDAWSVVIDRYASMRRPWVPDVVGRAYGNRGNARSRQGKWEAAISDYDQAAALCPWSVDPVLNRGVALENLGRFEDAAVNYRAVLTAAPQDPSAWNNLGNTLGGLNDWAEAERCFATAARLAPEFAFAAGNHAIAMFQLGKRDEALREMRTLLRRYPDFPDVRAALAAGLWAEGREAEAETQWERVDDPRYRDRTWLKSRRHWPPALLDGIGAFLDVRSVA